MKMFTLWHPLNSCNQKKNQGEAGQQQNLISGDVVGQVRAKNRRDISPLLLLWPGTGPSPRGEGQPIPSTMGT